MKAFKITVRSGTTIHGHGEASSLSAAKAMATRLIKESIPASLGNNLYHAAAKDADIENTVTGEKLAYIRLK